MRTHDLLRLVGPGSIILDALAPAWVTTSLERSPWVVVRRGRIERGRVPVGIRGMDRSERTAAFVSIADVVDRVPPEAIATRASSRRAAPFSALAKIAPLLETRRWGPGGSIAFELVTGIPVVSPASDLDIVIRADERLERDDAVALLALLHERAAPVRIDVIVETPRGGVALAELGGSGSILLRTADGPRLQDDPWAPP